MFTRHVLFSILAVVACAVPASATISYYTDATAASFNTDTTGLTAQTVSFDPAGQGFDSVLLNGVTFTGVDAGFPGTGGDLTTLTNPGLPWPDGALLARAQGSFGFSGGSITIALPSTAEAFSFYFSYAHGSIGSGDPVTISVAGQNSDGPLTVATLNTPYFVGALSTTTPFGLITISAGDLSDQLEIGGFSFFTPTTSGGGPGDGGGDPGSAPEPATFFLIGTGLTAAPLLRRCFRA